MSRRVRRQIQETDDAKQVFALVVAGKSFREVADTLGMTRNRAYDIYKRSMANLQLDDRDVNEYRKLVSQRLDRLLQALWPQAIKGKPHAVSAIIRIEERRAKMLGLDKPTKIDITHHIPALDPDQAAKRQQQRLAKAGFSTLVTAPPIALLPAPEPAGVEEP